MQPAKLAGNVVATYIAIARCHALQDQYTTLRTLPEAPKERVELWTFRLD